MAWSGYQFSQQQYLLSWAWRGPQFPTEPKLKATADVVDPTEPAASVYLPEEVSIAFKVPRYAMFLTCALHSLDF